MILLFFFISIIIFLVQPHPHMSLWTSWTSFQGVTDVWGWDAHKAQLRCPDDVSVDIGGCSARRALKPKLY